MDPKLKIEILSFAYKSSSTPRTNLLFDVRFIDNPYWVEELRPLNGMNKNVQDFVNKQDIAKEFLAAFKNIAQTCIAAHTANLSRKIGKVAASDHVYIIAFGCTGGQHRSVAIVEQAAMLIHDLFPEYSIDIWHREIDQRRPFVHDKAMANRKAEL